MEKQILELLVKMNDELTNFKTEINARMDKGFAEVNERLDSIDATLHGVGEQFEEMAKSIIELQDDVETKHAFVTHKTTVLEEDIFKFKYKQ